VNADEELYKAFFTHYETKDRGISKNLDCHAYLVESINGKVDLNAE